MKKIFKILLSIGLILLMFGCSKIASPTKVVDEYLKDCFNNPLAFLVEDFNLSELNETEKEMCEKINELLKKQTYTLDNEQIEDDSASVVVHFKVYDFTNIMQEAFKSYIATAISSAYGDTLDQEYDKLFAQAMIDKMNEAEINSPSIDFDYTFQLNKVDGKWALEDVRNDLDFVDGIFGGFISTFNNIGSSY